MPDPRFYQSQSPLSVEDIVRLTGALAAGSVGSTLSVQGAAPLASAGPTDVAFLGDRKHLAALTATRAGACFVTEAERGEVPDGCLALVTPTPPAAWALAAAALHRPRVYAVADGLIDPDVEIEEGAFVAANAAIGAGVKIGRGTHIAPGAVIGPGVAIGRDCQIGPNATIAFALIGDRVRIYAGARIGEAGFGAALGAGGVIDMPQLGRVILQDGVTIGANSCVDRGAYDDTVVGENTKLDNQVHIAHNVRVGRNCVMAAYTGISGSVTIGDGCAFGGRAGVTDHVKIGDGAQVAAAAGVFRDIPAGETWGGAPAQPIKAWMREIAALRRLASARNEK